MSGSLGFGPSPLKLEEFTFLRVLRGAKGRSVEPGGGPLVPLAWGESTHPGSPFSASVNSLAGPRVWSLSSHGSEPPMLSIRVLTA